MLMVSTKLCKPVFWTGTYCVASGGGVTMNQVKKYVENQREIAD